MASIQRNGNKYRVQVYVDGVRDSTTKATRQEAAQWALEREAELRGTKLPDKTFDAALRRYEEEVAPERGGGAVGACAGQVTATGADRPASSCCTGAG